MTIEAEAMQSNAMQFLHETPAASRLPLGGSGATHAVQLGQVVEVGNKGLIRPITTSPLGPLARATLDNLQEFFDRETTHRPSAAIWEALTDLTVTLEAMAEGTCWPSFYLCSL